MILSGYSNGVISSVALVNEETQLPASLRQVGGYIPIDLPIKMEPGLLRDGVTGLVEGYYRPSYEAGQYQENNSFPPTAELIRCCVNDPSPVPGLTNLQYVLYGMCSPMFGAEASGFHYWAGVFDDNGVPTGLRYTTLDMWLDFMTAAPPYEPMVWGLEWLSYAAGISETPYDDHLGEICVPILNVTPAGGFADATLYGVSLLGSTDKQTLMPGLGLPVMEEVAHIDIFTAQNAPALVWQPILDWIVSHTMARGNSESAIAAVESN